MHDFDKIKLQYKNVESLERELTLKQLQINSLLDLTQAINNNIATQSLFDMYHSFLSWEMQVKKMALYVNKEGRWVCATSIGIQDKILSQDISAFLPKFNRPSQLQDMNNILINEFDIVIPVLHKQNPIAYAFIGGFEKGDDIFNKIQFITTITNIVAVAIENKRLFKRQIEQERLRKEVELAAEMQRLLVPLHLPNNDKYQLSSIYKPHLGVGGDYYDYIEMEKGRFAFCIADISGKGVAAALLMANFQANFHSLIHQKLELDAFIRALNKSVLRITKGEKFITFFIAYYDTTTRKLRYVNAGHAPPYLYSGGKITCLEKGCTILGSFDELPDIDIGVEVIDEQAMILTYTDGITDVQNEKDEFFSEQIIKDLLTQHAKSCNAYQFNKLLLESMEKFKGEMNYPDDITILTCKLY
ncbi:MAG: SpoIIE family protein phosphatase [Saprospiraceae bacterium]|nr:SpoIIE family protein phosphatase [Saprospiraceae bacterium]